MFNHRLPRHQLNWHALQYAQYVCRNIEHILRTSYPYRQKYLKSSNTGEKVSLKAYPACAVAIQSAICGEIRYGVTSSFYPKNWHLNSYLRYRLEEELGPIGCFSGLCDNKIGCCAEVNAMRNLLNACSRCHNGYTLNKCIDNIWQHTEISAAYRPRTLEYIERCPNCITIFGHEDS